MIWKNRNALTFEGKRYWPLDMISKILEDSGNWVLAQSVRESPTLAHQPQRQHGCLLWKPPKPNFVKYNVGCAWWKENKIGGGA